MCVCVHARAVPSAEVKRVSVVCVFLSVLLSCGMFCSLIVLLKFVHLASPEELHQDLCSVTQPINTRLETTVKYLSPLAASEKYSLLQRNFLLCLAANVKTQRETRHHPIVIVQLLMVKV